MAARKNSAVTAPAAVARIPGTVIVLLGVCLLSLISTLGSDRQIDAVDGAAVLLGVASLVAVFGLVGRPSLALPASRLGIAWTAFLSWALVSVAVSGRVWAALIGEVTNLLGWFTLVAMTAIVLVVIRYGEHARRVLETVAPIVVFGEVTATIVELALGDMPRGSLPNSTYLGQAILLLLPFVMVEDRGGLGLTKQHRLILSGTTVITLAAAGSRVAAVVGIAWFLWILIGRSGMGKVAKLVATVATIAAVATGALTFARAEILGSTGVQTLGLRPQMWQTAALAVAERPLVGFGPDGFVAGGVSVTTPDLAREGKALVFHPGATDPHSLAVWVAVSTGVVGLALFLWSLVELVLAWRARIRAGHDALPGAIGVTGALVVFMTAPAALQVLPLMGFVAGVSLLSGRDRENAPQRAGSAALLAPGAVAVFAVVGILLTANAGTRLVLERHGAEVSASRVSLAQAATDVWRLDPHLAHLASLHWGWVAASDPQVAAGRPDLAAIRRAVEVDSRDPFVALEYARTLRFYGAPTEETEAAFLSAFERWPLFPVARAEYAVLLAQGGRDAEAREQIAVASLVDDEDGDRLRAITAAEDLLK